MKKPNQKNKGLNNMKKLLSFLVTTGLFFSLAGCQEGNHEDSGKLGGGQTDLKLASVAKFLRSDGSWYLTEQRHEIFAEPKAIRLTAKESFGEIIWTVQNGQSVIKKNPRTNVFDEELFKLMTDETISRGLLELYLAELESSNVGSGQIDSFTFEGKVYEPVFSDRGGIELYKDKSTGRKDLVIFQGKKRYVLYGYNYLKLEKDRYFPSKIDIYIYNDKSDRKLIAQFTCRLL
jgi:hypothetical protein